jgi:hypothetical protein
MFSIGQNKSEAVVGLSQQISNQLNTGDNGATGFISEIESSQVGGSLAITSSPKLAAKIELEAVGVSANAALEESCTVKIVLDVHQGAGNSVSVTMTNTAVMNASSVSSTSLTGASATASVTDSLGGDVIWLVRTKSMLIEH